MSGLVSTWLQVAALGVLAVVIERCFLRRAPAWTRELLWTLVLLRLLLPAEWFPLPGVAGIAAALPAAGTGTGAGVVFTSAEAQWALAVWAAGVALGVVAGVRAYRRGILALHAGRLPASREWQRAAATAAARLGLRAMPAVFCSPARGTPCVAGLLRPAVFVPRELPVGASAADREHVMLHELAHVQRRDPLRAVVVLLIQVAFWFHPVAWLAAARLALARELGADARAAATAPSGPSGYGATLLAWSAPRAGRLLVAAASGWPFERRIGARIDALARPRLPGLASGALALALCVAAQLALATPAAPPPPAPEAAAGRAPFSWPSDVRELPGCLQRRFLVLRSLAAERQPQSR